MVICILKEWLNNRVPIVSTENGLFLKHKLKKNKQLKDIHPPPSGPATEGKNNVINNNEKNGGAIRGFQLRCA